MDSDRWQRVEELCLAALERDESQQVAYLEVACAGDDGLRREVESLLARQKHASQFMETPAWELAAESLAADPELCQRGDPFLGRRLGPYRILERIGSGGMGEVYRAVRADEEYQQQVAIKLVRGGLDPGSINLRFRNERQILASLNHPNIARLLDGGTTEEGLPYVVMELIEGERIDRYCEAHGLSINERIKLFMQVCSAVQYAHQRLIVHRDIKPGNILVTGEGVPKLLDFGIAKILDAGGLGSQAEATLTMQRALTPGYASPEQVKGGAITTASDVYSLGVVLYELLTGCSPYRDLGKTPDQIAQAVCQSQPEKPSTAVLHASAESKRCDSGQIAQKPSKASREEFSKHLAGDLDNIVLMALRKEPERRYASVEQLSEDLRRHLEHLPVTACKDTIGYRTRKLVKRHKAGVAAAAAVLFALMTGLGVATHEARIARQQAEIARTQKLRAERRFNDVRALANSLIFGVHDAIQNLPGATPARQLLVGEALRYLDSLAQEAGGDPSLQRELASAYERLGDVQGSTEGTNLGDTAAAVASYQKALAIRESVAAIDRNDQESQMALAADYKRVANSRVASGEYQEALKYAQNAFIIQEHLAEVRPGPESAEGLAGSYYQIARCQADLGDFKAALVGAQKSVAIRKTIVAADAGFSARVQVRLAGTYGLMASVLSEIGELEQPVVMNRRSLDILERLSRSDPTNAMYREYLYEARYFIGYYSEKKDDLDEALEQFRLALGGFESLVAGDPKETRARRYAGACRKHIGMTLARKGKIEEALENALAGLAIAQDLYRMDPAEKSDKLTDLADAYQAVGFTYLRAAARPNMSAAASRELRHKGCSAYQKSLDSWLEAKRRGTLAAVDMPDQIEVSQAMASCDARVAKPQAR